MKNYYLADLVDILRKIKNLIRPSIIYKTNGERVKICTVKLITKHLLWFKHYTGKSHTWWQSSVIEQVFNLNLNGNFSLGCIFPSIIKSVIAYFVTFSGSASINKYELGISELTIRVTKTK